MRACPCFARYSALAISYLESSSLTAHAMFGFVVTHARFTGSPIFSDFQSDLFRVAVSRPLVKGNEDAGYEGAALELSTGHTTKVRLV